MATDPYTGRGIWTAALTGLCIIALACGLQAALAPLQKFREPIVKYLADTHAPPLEVTMWPSTHPWRMIAGGIVCLGLLFWVWLPVQVAVFLTRRIRAGAR